MPKTLEVTETLEQAIRDAVVQARETCSVNGATSGECAVAWDIVEELQAERSHRQPPQMNTSLNRYCDENPDALECRIYDV